MNRTDSRVSHDTPPLIWRGWFVALMLIVYAALRFGPGTTVSNLGLSFLVAALSYAAVVYLFCGVTAVAVQGRSGLLMMATPVAATLGWALCHGLPKSVAPVEIVLLASSGLTAGTLLARQQRVSTALLVGAIIVTLLGALSIRIQWELIRAAWMLNEENVMNNIATLGVGMSAAEMQVAAKRVLDLLLRLLPSLGILSMLTQYAIGVALFSYTIGPRWFGLKRPMEFARWRMPFWSLALLPPLAALRLLGGEPAGMLADNGLVLVLMPHLATGLSLLSYLFRHWQVPVAVRVLVYLLLIPAGLLGIGVIILLSFSDSYRDWRGRIEEQEELDNDM